MHPKLIQLIVIIAVFALLIVFFMPRNAGGELIVANVHHSIEYQCIGVKTSHTDDEGTFATCYGIPTKKKCFVQTETEPKKQSQCK